MFAQSLNALTGRVDWVHVDEDKPSQAPIPGLADSLYLDMLTDHRRNHAYAACLKNVVRPGQHVLDIGTGTGLLAMLAAKHAKQLEAPDVQAAHVTGCEVYPPMVRLAEQLTAHNNLTASIRICQKRSDELIIQQGNSRVSASRAVRDPASSASDAQQHVHAVQQNGRPRSGITSAAAKRKKYAEQQAMTTTAAESSDMPCKADVIVTEIFDSELLGEGILPTMRHAAKHLLQPGGVVIPATAVVYGQLVECPILAAQTSHPPAIIQQSIPQKASDQALKESTAAEAADHRKDAASMADKAQMHAMHVGRLYPHHLRLLSEPFVVFRFDFGQPPEGDGSQQLQVKATSPGTAHAIVMWWKLDVDQAGHITLDTAPPWLTPSAAASAADSPSQPAADSAAENSDVTVPLPEANAQMPKADSSRLDLQGMQTRSRQTAEGVQIGCEQPQQQWRDHWKQCWTPIHHHLTLEAGTLVEINAQHDDTSISMNACVVCSQDDAHIAQTDTYSDRTSESASYQCNAQPPSAAQLKTADSNVQNQQQLQTHQQALPNAIPTYEASFSALVSMSSQTEAAPCAASEITMPSTSNEGMHDNLAEPGASPNRLLMLADADRAGQYERAVQHVVAGAGPEAVCITSGAGPRLALMAATCDNVQQVICLQENAGQQRGTLQAAKAAGLLHKVAVADAQQLLDSDDPVALLSDLTAAPIAPADVFLSEPFYAALESLAPWSQLRCWHDRDVLIAAGLLKPAHRMIPCVGISSCNELGFLCSGVAGRVCGVAVALPDLWRTRAPVGVEQGVDLTPCNAALGAVEAESGPMQAPALSQTAPVLTRSVWQCGSGYQELTERVDLLTFDFSKALAGLQGSAVARVRGRGTMHAWIAWIEYKLTPDAEVWTGGAPGANGSPSYSTQAVHVLQSPVHMCEQHDRHPKPDEHPHQAVSAVLCHANFDHTTGNIAFDLSQV